MTSHPPVRLTRDARRRQLLDAATTVFAELGYHATAMDDVADRAGVSKPVLYQHFPSKLELYLALLAEAADGVVQLIQEAIASTDDNAVRVHRAVEAYFAVVMDNPAYRLVFESDLRGEPAVERLLDAATERSIQAVSQIITADTALDPSRARLLASALVGVSQISARFYAAGGAGVDRAEAVDLITTMAWRGISRFPRTGPA